MKNKKITKKFQYIVGGLSSSLSPEKQQKILNKKLGNEGFEIFSVVSLKEGANGGYIMFYAKKEIE